MEPQILLFHYSEAVLLARVLPLFDEVDQFLVQPLIEQLEIAFPEPILSSADVVQRIIDFVYAQRPSRVYCLKTQFSTSIVYLHVSSSYF